MNEDMKLVKNGFFIKDIYNNVIFYKYDEISHISPIYKEGGFHKFFVNFLKKAQASLKDDNIVKITEKYNKILNGWINYHSQESNLQIEKKLDTLLNHIEIMPGGEEYEKAKNNSESIISFNS